MSEDVYRALGQASSGFVEAPAGCGKTEAIVRTVNGFCDGTQLVLTHTHAGVDALRHRFRAYQVPSTMYHIDTIAGWSWNWVRRYPQTARYDGSTDLADWNKIYSAMRDLLQHDFIKKGVLNSYAGIIVDEYQDCTVQMHQLIIRLRELLPCRILGDDLQGIFDFNDPLVDWSDVKNAFGSNLGILGTPHRWINADNEALGRWLLDTRSIFRQDQEPEYRGSPIERRSVSYQNLSQQLIHLTYEKEGRICVIGPKARALSAGVQTALVKRKYRVLEPNELSELRKLIVPLAKGSRNQKARAAMNFLTTSYGGINTSEKTFINKLLRGQNQRVRRDDRQRLYEAHADGATPQLLLDLLTYIEQLSGISIKLYESLSALRCILEEHINSDVALPSLYADEIARRKYQRRNKAFRCIGSTLLVKGLEFDHVVILRDHNWLSNWGNHKDLYVALTRGTKTTTLMELTN